MRGLSLLALSVTLLGCAASTPAATDAGPASDLSAPSDRTALDAPESRQDIAAAVDLGADTPTASDLGAAPSRDNVLLVIADDFGVDQSPCHAVGRSFAPMPTLRALCARGVVFNQAWAAPTCSPTRAAILTGRHGFRTGVGAQIIGNNSAALPLTERTLPAVIESAAPGSRTAACVGKWHLSNTMNGGANHPATAGFGHFAGLLSGQLPDYNSWPRTVDGVTATSTRYATSAQVDDALAWLSAQRGPWLLWLAFNAPHAPFHLPPVELHSYDHLAGVALPQRPVDHYRAMIEAMDTELGRLLDAIPAEARARTWVVFVGDNGTPRMVVSDPVPANHAKDTLYQGGVHVPLVIAGPGVVAPGRTVDALVHVVDLFPTILGWAGVDVAAARPDGRIDGVSLAPYLLRPDAAAQRRWVYTELFDLSAPSAQDGRAMRDEAFKLLRFEDGRAELYDLRTDPQESRNLLAAPLSAEAMEHHSSLDAAMRALLAAP
jgi:arylsulfatase A-like enzyme